MLKFFWEKFFKSKAPISREQERQQELQKELLYLNGHALQRKDAGNIGGEEVEVWANYVRLEVRNATGMLRFELDVDVVRKETVISQARLVGGRYLVIERMEGVTPLDLEVWDFVQGKWSFKLSRFAEVLLHDTHPSLP